MPIFRLSMKKLILLYIVLLSEIVTAQTWTQLPNFSSNERDDAVAFVIGNKAYCGSGLSPWFTAFGDFRVLDMNTEQWSSISALPNGEHRQYATGFSGGGKGYVFGGVSGSKFYRNVLEYNPLLDTWTTKTSLPDSGISGAASFTLNNVAYVVCGRTAQKLASNTVWAYNFANHTWQQKANFPFGNRWRASGASLNGKGYLLFGGDSANVLHKEFYEYDPVLDLWTALPSFPGLGRNYSSLTAINGQLVVFGGIDSAGVYQNDLWRYEPNSRMWRQQKSLPAKGRKGGLAFTNGTALYYTTGIDSNSTRLNETWKCDNPLVGLTENTLVGFRVYPNPVKDFLRIDFAESTNGSVEIKFFNQTGMIVLETTLDKNENLIDLSRLNTGVYILNIAREGIAYHYKLFKE